MENPISASNFVTLLVIDHVIMVVFVYALVRLLTGGKPILERRQVAPLEETEND